MARKRAGKKNSSTKFKPLIVSLWVISTVGKTFRTILSFLLTCILLLFVTFWRIVRHIRISPPQIHLAGKSKKIQTVNKVLATQQRVFYKSIKFGLLATGLILVFSTYSLYLILIANDLPNPNRLKDPIHPLTTEIYDRNGNLLYRLYEERNRTLVNLSDLPQDLLNATIAIEDQNFYQHAGVDIFGITRAFINNFQKKQIQGGSTITQQLIKNVLLTSDKTWKRKIQEVALSFWAERIFQKKDILQMYFNEVPYGGVFWGIQSASLGYFDKDAKDLTLAEATYLAGLPASPTLYSPHGSHPELAKERQKLVLDRMVADKFITSEQAKQAFEEELKIKPPSNSLQAGHFVMYVKSLLEEKYGARLVNQGGLKVITSLDLGLQEKAEKIVNEELDKIKDLKVSNGAAMIVDPKTGQILAMVGNRNYFDRKGGNFNVALALRQPGSSIKPVTYAAAFNQGYTPGNIIVDAPTVFKNAWEVYAPVNYDSKFHGPVSIRTSLGSSYNIPAVITLYNIGLPKMLTMAQNLGITTLTDTKKYGLSLTLGAGEVRLIDMMTVYSTFSQMGDRLDPNPILQITDNTGKVLEDNRNPKSKKVLNPAIAYMISDILADNKARTPAFGPNSQLVIPGHVAAVKTGTSDKKKDNWALGFTPSLVVGVWVGNMDNTNMGPISSGITGATPIWNRLMTTALEGKPDEPFQRPATIGEAIIDGNRDLVIKGQPVKSFAKTQPQGPSITLTDPLSKYSAQN